VAEDADFHTSSDPAFTTKTLTPKLVTGLATINLSAIFAQHPQLGGTDFIGAELDRALAQEINRAFLSGDNTTNAEEPDGLLIQATASTVAASAVPIDATAFASLVGIPSQVEDYLQQEIEGVYILHPKFVDGLATVLKFTGSEDAAIELSSKVIAGKNYIRGISLPVDTGETPDAAPGLFIADPATIVHASWFGS